VVPACPEMLKRIPEAMKATQERDISNISPDPQHD
jgi:hypothetical protein